MISTLTTLECRRPCTWDSRVWPWPPQGHPTDLWAAWAGSHSKPEDSVQSLQPGISQSSGQCLCLSECICSVTVSNWGESEQTFSPRVNKTIQHLSRLLYEVWLVGIVLQLVIRLQVQDHVQRLPVVGDLLVQSSQVELVLNVVLVNLTEELISSQAAEPRYPGNLSQDQLIINEKNINVFILTSSELDIFLLRDVVTVKYSLFLACSALFATVKISGGWHCRG